MLVLDSYINPPIAFIFLVLYNSVIATAIVGGENNYASRKVPIKIWWDRSSFKG